MSSAIRIVQGKFGRVALLDMDRPLVTHAHSQCHVLIKVSGEDTFFNVRNQLDPLTNETAILVNAWERHSYLHRTPASARSIILALCIEPHWLGRIEKKLIASGHPGFFPHSCVKISKPLRELANMLAMQMWHDDQMNEQYLEWQLSNLMMEVVDAFSDWRNFTGSYADHLSPVRDFRIGRAISYIRANIGAELDSDKLAKEACLSRAHFFRLFQQCTNLTPILYANVLRMEAAIRGLTQTRQSLVSLSESLGFSAPSHFTRFFQQHFGVVPSQYRKVADVYSADDAPDFDHQFEARKNQGLPVSPLSAKALPPGLHPGGDLSVIRSHQTGIEFTYA